MEKFAINSLISATHTAEMDEEDRNDIIKKINTAGDEKDGDNAEDSGSDDKEGSSLDFGDAGDAGDGSGDSESSDSDKGEEDLSFNESEMGNLFLENPPKNNMFQPGSNDILGEGGDGSQTRYMFFSNLEQMRRQAGILLDFDQAQIEEILNNGHDWAADHIAEAKNNMDQVFDFLMNEIKGDGEEGYDEEEEYDYSEWSKPMELTKDVPVSSDLAYHIQNEVALGESVFRYGSDKFFSLLNEVKSLYSRGLIKLNENDEFIVNDFDNGYLQIGDDKIKMNFIFEEVEDVETLNEAEFQGKKVEIGKPKRGGSKKFYVYVRNPKTGKVKKVSFGAKSGGGNLAVKLKDPKARKAFADRHNCEQKNDKTKPGYWACRLPRYAKLLGLSGGGKWW